MRLQADKRNKAMIPAKHSDFEFELTPGDIISCIRKFLSSSRRGLLVDLDCSTLEIPARKILSLKNQLWKTYVSDYDA